MDWLADFLYANAGGKIKWEREALLQNDWDSKVQDSPVKGTDFSPLLVRYFRDP